MKSFVYLWKANLKRKHGLNIVFMLIMALAVLLMNIGLVVWCNLEASFDRKCEETNSADIICAMPQSNKEDISKYIDSLDEVDEVEYIKSLYTYAEYNYGDSNMTGTVLFLERGQERTIEKITNLKTDNKTDRENLIYLPLVFQTGAGYELGDQFDVMINNQTHTFYIGGFFEDMLLGSTNGGLTSFLLDKEQYQKLNEDTDGYLEGSAALVKLKNADDTNRITTAIFNYANDKLENASSVTTINQPSILTARCNTAKIIAAILFAFSIVILFVAFIVIRYKIHDYVKDNIVNFGILKSLGYASSSIIWSVVMQFVFIITISLLIGLSVSTAAMPYLADMLASLSGMSWEQGFDPVLALIIVAVVYLTTLLISYVSLVKINKLYPVRALRNEDISKHQKKNHMPFANVNLKPVVLLSLKYFLNHFKQNISIAIVFLGMSFVSMFAIILGFNTVIDNYSFVKSAFGVYGDVQIIQDTSDEKYVENFNKKLSEMDDVEKVVYYGYERAFYGNQELFTYVSDDFGQLDADLCYKGSFPENGKQIAISGLTAQKYHKEIGDDITISYGNKKQTYEITGFIQSAYSTGYECAITIDGYSYLRDNYEGYQLMVYLNDGTNIDQYMDRVLDFYGDDIVSCNDFMKNIDSYIHSYVNLLSIVISAVFIVTIAILLLVMYLVVTSMMSQMYKQFGIQKAIGYSGSQLVAQISLGFLPAIIIGTVIGGALGYYFSKNIISVLLNSVGIIEMNLITNAGMYLLNIGGICLISYVAILLLALRVRKISVVSLIRSE